MVTIAVVEATTVKHGRAILSDTRSDCYNNNKDNNKKEHEKNQLNH